MLTSALVLVHPGSLYKPQALLSLTYMDNRGMIILSYNIANAIDEPPIALRIMEIVRRGTIKTLSHHFIDTTMASKKRNLTTFCPFQNQFLLSVQLLCACAIPRRSRVQRHGSRPFITWLRVDIKLDIEPISAASLRDIGNSGRPISCSEITFPL